MTRDEAMLYVTVVITTLLELEEETRRKSMPRSTLYTLTQERGMSFNDFKMLESIMRSAGWVLLSSDTMRLTKKGRERALEFKQVLAESVAAKLRA